MRRLSPGARSLLFLGLTLFSVYFTYAWAWSGGPLGDPRVQLESAEFAVALLSILLAHEMAHYLVARRHGFALSLPLFIPFPVGIGTLGAIIRLRSRPRSRSALLEMAAAGPLAGFLASALLFAATLGLTRPPVELEPGVYTIFQDPPVARLLATLLAGAPLDRYAVLHPVSLAAWFGFLLTALNLLPLGQLDGGHVLNALFPRWSRRVSLALLLGLGLAGFLWTTWWVWGVLLLLLGAWRSLPVPLEPPPSRRARWVAVAVAIAFAACFSPVPVVVERVDEDGAVQRLGLLELVVQGLPGGDRAGEQEGAP